MSASTSAQTMPLGSSSLADPIARFESDVNARKVAGASTATAIGWLIYLLIIIDSLLNARGSGSVSILLAEAILTPQGDVSAKTTGLTIALSLAQLVVLAIGGSFLIASPWRRWLRAALRETWPGAWLVKIFRALIARTGMPTFNHDQTVEIFRDIIIYGLAVLVLAPIPDTIQNAPTGASLLIWIVILGASYGATQLVIAVAGKARRDSASASGLIAGFVIPLVAAAYAGPTIAALHTTAGGLSEFVYFQLGVFTTAILAIWLVQLGSVADDELVTLQLGGSPMGVIRELPDLTSGAYKPFQFQVKTNGEKVILLSRPVENASFYDIHSTLGRHDPTMAQWVLVNLSELERGNGSVSLTHQGQARYLETTIRFRVATATPEQYLQRLRGKPGRIPVEDLAAFQNQVFSNTDLIGTFRSDLDQVLSGHLDRTVTSSPFGTRSLISLNTISSSMRLDVSQLRQALDVQIAAFQANAAMGLRLDRAEELRAHLMSALKDVAPMMGRVREAYANIARLDEGLDQVRSALQSNVSSEIQRVMQQLTQARQASGDRSSEIIHILDLVTLTVQSVDVRLTPEAQALHQEVTGLYKEAEAHWSQACGQFGSISKEHGERVKEWATAIVDGRTPAPVRNWLLGMLAGSGGQPASSLGPNPPGSQGAGAPPPVFQRSSLGSSASSTTQSSGTPNSATQAPAAPPIFKRGGSRSAPGAGTPPTTGFPD